MVRREKIYKYGRTKKKLMLPLEFDNKEYTNLSLLIKSNDMRIYRGATLLTPGSWSDMITQSPVYYSPEVLSKFATNWTTNYLDLGHDITNPLSIVGSVQNPRWENGRVKGDLYISMSTQNGKDVVALIDSGLVNHLSVEMSTTDYWDTYNLRRCADNIEFLGAAIIGPYPACEDAKINE